MQPMAFDLYQLLGVAPDATTRQIKTAFREVARRTHPDTGASEVDRIWFDIAKQVYEILGDSEMRAQYDARRVTEAKQVEVLSIFEELEESIQYLMRHFAVTYGGPEAVNRQEHFDETFKRSVRRTRTWRMFERIRDHPQPSEEGAKP